MSRLDVILLSLCECLFPPEMAFWAQAMQAEARALPVQRVTTFCAGCLLGAARARLGHPPTQYAVGRSGLLLVSLMLAVFHLGSTWSGIRILEGARPDHTIQFLAAKGSRPDLAGYLTIRPFMVFALGALGAVLLGNGLLLARRHSTLALAGWTTALMLSFCLVLMIELTVKNHAGVVLMTTGVLAQGVVLTMAQDQPNRGSLA